MRIIIYVISLILVMILGLSVNAHARDREILVRLEPLDRLVHLATNGDVNLDSKVYIKPGTRNPEKSCYCVCWGTEWICTSAHCNKHLQAEESCLFEEEE